ncbi:hypothetical protein ACTXJX_10190 [Glutamicibacter ardleyensis]|uniref:hypothetical protein n=1 Tax=Glutamicibacter ardleyensis TaxID=225894 RepID=UPI003FD09689
MTDSIKNPSNAPAPAGFRAHTVQDTINGEPCGESWTEYLGPEATSGNITVESFWTEEDGIEFHVTNNAGYDNEVFTREELDALPGLIKQVISNIDVAHAVEYMKAHPVPKSNGKVHTIIDVDLWCGFHEISSPAAFMAFGLIHGHEHLAGGK